MKERIIMGIDPGTNLLGYGVISFDDNTFTFITCGSVKYKAGGDSLEKLGGILRSIRELILQHHPTEIAIESPFFGKNIQSMLKLGRAQGVAIAVSLDHGIPVQEYAPKRVKQAVTGSGAASKTQVAAMAARLTGVKIDSKFEDATDALAVAICHALTAGEKTASTQVKTGSKKAGSWGSFIDNNPERIKRS
jgi:crossover junction endodeoxyribonuclease RuvC